MLIKIGKNTTVHINWKPIEPTDKVTYRIIEIGYETCSKFETIWFFIVGKICLMVDVFDADAAEKARVAPAIKVSIPPPPRMREEVYASNVIKFPARRR